MGSSSQKPWSLTSQKSYKGTLNPVFPLTISQLLRKPRVLDLILKCLTTFVYNLRSSYRILDFSFSLKTIHFLSVSNLVIQRDTSKRAPLLLKTQGFSFDEHSDQVKQNQIRTLNVSLAGFQFAKCQALFWENKLKSKETINYISFFLGLYKLVFFLSQRSFLLGVEDAMLKTMTGLDYDQ